MKSRKCLELSFIALLIVSLVLGSTSFAAASIHTPKPTLSARSLSIRTGKTAVLKVKNVGLKVTWSTSNSKET